jgi:hypothetical protein
MSVEHIFMHKTGQYTPESQLLPPQHHENYTFISYYFTCILWDPCPYYKPSIRCRALYIRFVSFALYFENTILTLFFCSSIGDGPYVSNSFDSATLVIAITQILIYAAIKV